MKSRSILDDITSAGRNLFSKESSDAPSCSSDSNCDSSLISDSRPVLVRSSKSVVIQKDFISWIEQYNGTKFSFIHCDFPQEDKTVFFRLLNSLQKYSFKIASESSHLMLWFDMENYEITKAILNSCGFAVDPHPLIWAKSRKTRTQSSRPQRSYETAFLASRNARPLVRRKPNHYRSPATAEIAKPEPMLSYFFSMLIDETTDFFDPTADSGAATLAARNCGARSIFGLEVPQ